MKWFELNLLSPVGDRVKNRLLLHINSDVNKWICIDYYYMIYISKWTSESTLSVYVIILITLFSGVWIYNGFHWWRQELLILECEQWISPYIYIINAQKYYIVLSVHYIVLTRRQNCTYSWNSNSILMHLWDIKQIVEQHKYEVVWIEFA